MVEIGSADTTRSSKLVSNKLSQSGRRPLEKAKFDKFEPCIYIHKLELNEMLFARPMIFPPS